MIVQKRLGWILLGVLVGACGEAASNPGGDDGGSSDQAQLRDAAQQEDGGAQTRTDAAMPKLDGSVAHADAAVSGDSGAQPLSDAATEPDAQADAGVDATVPPAEDGASCENEDDCASGHCVDGLCCDTECAGTCMACNEDATGEADGTCAPVELGEDPDDECASDALSCLAGVCDGAGACAPMANGEVCREATGVCDVAETCNAGLCPSDAVASNVTVCRTAGGVCDVAETCDGANKTCAADAYVTAGTTCRASAGVCDITETCTGSSPACPGDLLYGFETTCRAANGPCDVAEQCMGSADCPSDAVKANATVCRMAAGPCDYAETCNGSAKTCPNDAFASNATTCRAAAGVCDVAEMCTGSGALCPTDVYASSAVSCRASQGTCDPAEMCSGTAITCGSDQHDLDGCAGGYYCNTTTHNCTINPKRVFTSSMAHNGNFGGLAGADMFCNQLAMNASLTGTYKAWLSDATTSVGSRMTHHTGVYQLVNGTKIADNWTDLTDGSLDAAILRTETGAGVSGSEPWTGSYATGLANTEHCNSWSSSASNVYGHNGQSSGTTGWSTEGMNGCNTLARIYCFEQ